MASGGFDICFSSTNFQKTASDRKGAKIQYDISGFYQKHKNKAEFKCLDDSEVFSSDFPDLKTTALNDLSDLNSLNGLNDLNSLIL